MEVSSPALERIRDFYNGLSPRRRGVLITLLVVSVGGAVALTAWARRPQWSPLVDDLEPGEARSLVQSLREEGYQVRVKGDRLEVPVAQLEEARLSAYGSDLGSDLPGMTMLLDRKGMGLTREQEKATYQVALQGELARTISRLSTVRRATVQLVLPEDALFPEDRVDARASVMLDLKPGADLHADQVVAITNLVAASVPQLSAEDVMVADTDGTLLTRPLDEDAATTGVDRMREYTRELERSLEDKAMAQLGRVVGPDRATVQVTATVDTAHRESSAVDFDGTRSAARSIQSSESEETSSEAMAMGVPGTGANLPETEARAGAGGNGAGEARTASEVLNYEIPQNSEHRVQPPGELLGLSVSVLVDGIHTEDAASGETTYAPRPPEDLENIESLVAAAVGLQPARGDHISVVNMPFQPVATVAEGGTSKGAGLPAIPIAAVLKWLAVIVGLFLGYRYVVKPVTSAALAPPPPPEEAEMFAARPGLLEARSPAFRQQLRHLLGDEAVDAGDPVEGALRSNLPATVRSLKDWIEEG